MSLEELEKGLEEKIKDLFLNSVPRYYDHTMSVVSNMKKILERENLGEEGPVVLTTAAYLHDIGYVAPYGNDFVGNIEDQSVKIPTHCETGVEISERLLSELGFDEKTAARVVHLVSVHHGTPESDENLKLLLEADKV